jgi:hypothetical protein
MVVVIFFIMRIHANPVHRKAIIPWYDSTRVCIGMMAAMAIVIVFGVIGIAAAWNHAQFRRHLWLPMVLVLLGAGVFISIAVRLIRGRFTKT